MTDKQEQKACAPAQAGATQPEAASGHALILLVDDERAFADTLAFRLGQRDLPCRVVYRGEDALAALDERELEVALLDVNMPGMHGLDVLHHIKAKRPDMEVLLLTGESGLATVATGMRRGAGDYLVKPVDFNHLLDSVAEARKRVREHRERLRAAEAGKLMALGALAAGVGHEINNPLQIILQRSEWLQELLEDARNGSSDFDELAKSAQIIQNQAKRAGEITSQLLGLAHSSRKGVAQADPGEIAGRVAGYYAARAQDLETAMLVDIEPGLPLIPCSAAELEPVLSHLLRNALDAVEAAGSRIGHGAGHNVGHGVDHGVGCNAARTSSENTGKAGHTVRLAVRRHKNGVRIQVADTGEGIDPDLAQYIFDPFFSLRPVGKGTGLGLTVCHSIITALRGHIGYAPAPGGGAVFTVDVAVQ